MLAIVICLGGLLDSNLLQMWLFDKTPVSDTINDIPLAFVVEPDVSRLCVGAGRPFVGTAILNQQTRLSFSIQLDKFVDLLSTGMPKLFASDIVVIDHATGKRIPARVEVNKPFTYDGISIYRRASRTAARSST